LHSLWTFPLHFKSNTFSALSNFIAYTNTQFSATIKAVQCDNRKDNSSTHTFFLTNALFTLSIMFFGPYCFRPPCLHPTGLRPSPRHPPCLAFYPPRLSSSPRCTLPYWANRQLTSTSEFSAVSVTQTCPPLHHTNLPPAPPCVSSLAIPLITKDIAALTSLPTESSSPGMSSLMKLPFLWLSVTTPVLQ